MTSPRPMPQTRKSLKDGGRLVIFAVLLATCITITDYAPRLEGDLLPVVGPAQLTAAPRLDMQGHTILSLRAIKKRECSWRGISCYLGSRGGNNVPVPCAFTDAPKVRGRGDLHWDGLEIGIPEVLVEHTFADVTHRCHPLWLTRTPFWTGSEAGPR